MSTCVCAPAHLTSVAFPHGIVMQRCQRHELQMWTKDGRPTDTGTVRTLLKDLFVEKRGTRSTSPIARPAPARMHLPVQSHDRSDVALDAGADEALTALLRSRGLQGSWAVA
ncbi:MAG: hypothetical protein JWM62_1290 [Frankiales bacterium]|jgi:hypothetical protein|nr:hypothetical protein [Frankiales bacterium]